MSETAKPTPTPWFVNDLRASRMRELGWTGPSVDKILIINRSPKEIAESEDGSNAIIARISFENRPEELTEGNLADAALIVTAVNAHAALLEACKEFVRKVECGEARSVRSYAQMKAALRLAEGEKE